MKKHLVFALLLLFSVNLAVFTQAANPFSGQDGPETETKISSSRPVNSWIYPVIRFSQKYQKVFKQRLTVFAKQMKTRPFGGAFWLFLWFSFLYGIFHALGPGHGKSIAVLYFLSRPGKAVHGFLMGNLLTFSHVLSATTLVMVLYFMLKVSGLTTLDQFGGYFKLISAVLLMGIGLYLIWKSLHEYKHWAFEEGEGDQKRTEMKSLILTSLVTGLIPCPGAAIILSYALITGIVIQGLLAMISISLGMGFTTSSVAIFTIVSRQTFLSLARKNLGHFKIIYTTLSCAGALAIFILAAIMLMGML